MTKLVLQTNPLRCAVPVTDPTTSIDKWRPASLVDDLFNREFALRLMTAGASGARITANQLAKKKKKFVN